MEVNSINLSIRLLSLRKKSFTVFFRIAQKIPGIHFYEYVVWEGVCYVVNPKAASSSLRKAFEKCAIETSGNIDKSFRDITYFGSIKSIRRLSGIKFIFTIVRDPTSRIVSCWEQKVNRRDPAGFRFLNQYFFFYYPVIRFGQSFSRFMSAISRISDRFSEKHFMSQCKVVGYGEIPYSKLYTLENINKISDDLAPIVPYFSLDSIENVTGSSATNLCDDTKRLIRARYRQDFELYESLTGREIISDS